MSKWEKKKYFYFINHYLKNIVQPNKTTIQCIFYTFMDLRASQRALTHNLPIR